MKLSEAQVKRHWREWAKVVRANGWTGPGLRENATPGRDRADRNAPDCRWHRQVWAHAAGMAAQEDRGVAADDLRHACYFVATERAGRKFSLKDLDNDAFGRVLNLFQCMEDPDHLNAMTTWEAYRAYDRAVAEKTPAIDRPEKPGERRQHEWLIKKTNPGYLARILKERFDTAAWQTLSIRGLRQLSLTLRTRPRSQRQPKAYQRKTKA